MEQQSILICDYCKQILEAPILLPCEHTICQKHYTPDMMCIFCKEHHGQFYTVLKKLENLTGKLRVAKQSHEATLAKIKEYESVKFNPLACINQYFVKIKEEINNHKQLTLSHLNSLVEQKNKEILDNLDAIRNQCIDELDYKCKVNLNDEMADVKLKMEAWHKDLDLTGIKISETSWETIRAEASKYNQIMTEKITLLKEDFLLNKEIKFVSDLKNLDLINYGKLAVSQNNSDSVIISLFCIHLK